MSSILVYNPCLRNIWFIVANSILQHMLRFYAIQCSFITEFRWKMWSWVGAGLYYAWFYICHLNLVDMCIVWHFRLPTNADSDLIAFYYIVCVFPRNDYQLQVENLMFFILSCSVFISFCVFMYHSKNHSPLYICWLLNFWRVLRPHWYPFASWD